MVLARRIKEMESNFLTERVGERKFVKRSELTWFCGRKCERRLIGHKKIIRWGVCRSNRPEEEEYEGEERKEVRVVVVEWWWWGRQRKWWQRRRWCRIREKMSWWRSAVRWRLGFRFCVVVFWWCHIKEKLTELNRKLKNLEN